MKIVSVARFKVARFTRVIAVVGASGLLAFGAAACGSSSKSSASGVTPSSSGTSSAAWNAVLASACKEGTVDFVSEIAPGLLTAVANAFEKDYPCIHVNQSTVSENVLLPQIQEQLAAKAPAYDVIQVAKSTFLDTLNTAGSLVDPSIEPNYAAIPATGRPKPGWAYVQYDPFVIAYNTNLVKTKPTGYADLLNPSLKGKTATTAPIGSAVILGWYRWLNTTNGANYEQQLAANRAKPYLGSTAIAQAVASGEQAYGAFAVPSSVLALKQQGAPIDYVVPNPTMCGAETAAILKGSKHPNAALVFMNWFYSQAGAKTWAGQASASPIPTPGGIDASKWVIPNVSLPQADIDDFTASFNKLFG